MLARRNREDARVERVGQVEVALVATDWVEGIDQACVGINVGRKNCHTFVTIQTLSGPAILLVTKPHHFSLTLI